MFCTNCGAELIEGNAFCTSCGQKIEAENLTVQEEIPNPAPQASTAIPEEAAPAPAAKAPGKGIGTAALILGIIGSVLAALTLLGNGCTCGLCGWDDACMTSFLGGITGFLPFALGIAGIIVSIVAMKRSKKEGVTNKKALIGLLLSIAAILLALVSLILAVVVPSFATVYTVYLMDKH